MSDDEDDTHCPLCCEELDLSDQNYLPCPCGYRVCMWCWHHIRENLNGLCPACRTPYKSDPHAFSAVDRDEIVKKNRERKQKEKQERKVTDNFKSTTTITSKSVASSIVDRKHLHNYRVVQRNLVYVIGVPAQFANEEMLRKAEFFGQYGKIGKIVIHRNNSASHTSVSAYVTFVYKEDAKACIQALDSYWMDNHVLRASFGTTKYCNNFIRGVPCNNPECVYLHDLGDDDDRFTKEEIQAGHSKLAQAPGKDQVIVTGNGGPSGTGKRPTGEPVLPPPVFIQDNATTSTTRPAAVSRSSTATWSNTNNNTSNVEESPKLTPISGGTPLYSSALTAGDHSPKISLPPAVDAATVLKRSGSGGELKGKPMKETEKKTILSHGKMSGDTEDSKESQQKTNSKQSLQNKNSPHLDPQSDPILKENTLSMAEQKSDHNTITPTRILTPQRNQKPQQKPINPPTLNPLNKNNSFNGLSKSAVFPVPVSSLSISVWSAILESSSDDLHINPFGQLLLPFSELLDLTMPPVDAIGLAQWPKPQAYYQQGVRADGTCHAPAKKHSHKGLHEIKNETNTKADVTSNSSSTEGKNPQAQPLLGTPQSMAMSGDNSSNSSGNSSAPSGINALRQLFPGVKLSLGPVGPR